MGWLHSCTSKAQSARQDNCCAAVQPSHAVANFLRKSARMVSSSFFSEKKTRSFEADLQRTQRGPQPRLQAFAVLSKTAKRPCPRFEFARERREIKINLPGYAAPSWKRSTSQAETKIRKKFGEGATRLAPQSGFEPRRNEKDTRASHQPPFQKC